MNIAVVTEFFLPDVYGGVEQYSFNFAIQMALRGHDVDVFTSNGGRTSEQMQRYPFAIRAVGRLGLRCLQLSGRYDVVVVQNFARHLYPFLLLGSSGLSVVLVPHGAFMGPSHERDLSAAYRLKFLVDSVFDRLFSPMLLRRTKGIVALSELERRFLIESLGVDARKVFRVPAGVPDELFSLEGHETHRWSWLGGVDYVLSIGRIDARKAQEHVVRALRFVDSDVHFVFAGQDRGFAPYVLNLAAELGLGQRVHYLGIVEEAEKAHLLDRSLALVLSSKWEMLPTIILEAMARGRPVIATSVGANPELVIHGRNGLLYPFGDAEILAERISFLRRERGLAEDMGQIGRDYAWKHHRWSKIAGDLEKVLIE